MKLLLDSTLLIDALRLDPAARELIEGAVDGSNVLYTSAANIAEVYAGMRPKEAPRTADVLSNVVCLPVTFSIGQRAGELKSWWSSRGRTLELIDMIVAATAIEGGLALVTKNRKDFPMEEIAFWP